MAPKSILMIAYHYPPILHSSGIHRTLKFAQYLPEFGWQPSILTVHPRAYDCRDPSFTLDLQNIPVKRAFALHAAKHLSIKGRYLQMTALPDPWISWWLGAVPTGLQMIRRQRPAFIWSTYPIPTAHLIGLSLHKLTGIPWIADFRDPMTDAGYPADPLIRKAYHWIETKTVEHCTRAIFTTPDALKTYANRFPDQPDSKWSVVANGYDEAVFREIEQQAPAREYQRDPCEKKILIHAGALYPSERNPEPFFSAVAALKAKQRISENTLKIILRASGNENNYRRRSQELNIQDLLFFEPPLPYKEALQEMLDANGLLLFQAANCNHQIPAKAYEYIRAKKPVLALTPTESNTAQLLRSANLNDIVPIDSANEIETGLMSFLESLAQDKAADISDEKIHSFSRHARTKELANLLHQSYLDTDQK